MKEIRFWTCFGLTLAGMWALVAMLVHLGLEPFDLRGVAAIVAYAFLSMCTLYSIIEEISR